MNNTLHRLKLVRATNKLYSDHEDSLRVYAATTGAEIDLDSVHNERLSLVREILDGDLDNEPVT